MPATNASAASTSSTGRARARKRLLRTSCWRRASPVRTNVADMRQHTHASAQSLARVHVKGGIRPSRLALRIETVGEDAVGDLSGDAGVAAGCQTDIVERPTRCVLEAVALQAETHFQRRRAIRIGGQGEVMRLPTALAGA